nr:hypothetical protein [Tanacetum cinerariifolium]
MNSQEYKALSLKTSQEQLVIHPGSIAARIKDRKCRTRGGSSKPPVKYRLVQGSSSTRATRVKTASLKDNSPFLTISDDDDEAVRCQYLSPEDFCHHPSSLERHIVVDNAINRRSRELLKVIEQMKGDCEELKERPPINFSTRSFSSGTILVHNMYTLAISFISSLTDMENTASVPIVLLCEFHQVSALFNSVQVAYLTCSFEVKWLTFHEVLVSTLSNDRPSIFIILIVISISIPSSISIAITVTIGTLIITVPKSNVPVSLASF